MKKFAKGEPLLAADLNALAGGLEELQAAPRSKAGSMRGHVTYGHAWYNVTGTDGTALNAPGVLAGVEYVSGIDEPCIEDGIMKLLPPSGGGGGECSCVLAQYNVSGVDDVAGKVAGVYFYSSVDEPMIENGVMKLPLAEYVPPEGSTAVDSHVGGIVGVRYVSGIDAPRISAGMIELVPDSGGGECSCVLAQYNISGVDDVAGKVAGVYFYSSVDEPMIENGVMKLPLAEYVPTEGTTAVDSHVGGIAGIRYGGSGVDAPRIVNGVIELPTSGGGSVLGFRDRYGNPVAFDTLEESGAAIELAAGAYGVLSVSMSEGYLYFSL